MRPLVNLLQFPRENLHLLEEGQGLPREELDERIAREEFRRPRESLLNICTEFYKHCGPRLKILQNLAGEPRVTALELLDVKSHMRYWPRFPCPKCEHSLAHMSECVCWVESGRSPGKTLKIERFVSCDLGTHHTEPSGQVCIKSIKQDLRVDKGKVFLRQKSIVYMFASQ